MIQYKLYRVKLNFFMFIEYIKVFVLEKNIMHARWEIARLINNQYKNH